MNKNNPRYGLTPPTNELGHDYIDLLDPFVVYVVENQIRKAFRVPARERYDAQIQDQPIKPPDGNGLVWRHYSGSYDVVSAKDWFAMYSAARLKTSKFIAQWGCWE